MKKFIIITLSLLFACSMGHRVMTMDNFQTIEVGTTAQELEKTAGKPYSIRACEDGAKEYEYLERVTAADRVVETRHYLFRIKNGKVESKQTFTTTIPPLDQRNSYELQTSSN